MTAQPEKPDFIVDQFGNVQDVRHLKHDQESAPSSSQKPETTPSHYGKSEQWKFRSPRESESYLYFIPVLIVIAIILVSIFVSARQASLANASNGDGLRFGHRFRRRPAPGTPSA
jgi:hypothetical protein